MRRTILAMIISLGLVVCASAQGQRVGPDSKLAWDANTEPDVAAYRIYLSATSGAYDFSSPSAEIAHPATEWPIVATDGTWFAVATAVDDVGNESPPSNEVTFDMDATAPGAPTIRIEISVSVSVVATQ